MTIFDFLNLFIEQEQQKVSIYDLNSGSTIFNGMSEDLPSNLGELEILSIDNIYEPTDTITINVEV